MMRPTASSASKAHERPADVKSPPKRTPSLLKSKATTKPKTPKFEKTEHKTNGAASATATDGSVDDAAAGSSTPQTEPAAEEAASSADLEATPAFNAETIR